PPRAKKVAHNRIIEPERLSKQQEGLSEEAEFLQPQRVASDGKQERLEGQKRREIFAGSKHTGGRQPRQQAQTGKESNGRIKKPVRVGRRGCASFPKRVENHQRADDSGLGKTRAQGKFVVEQ